MFRAFLTLIAAVQILGLVGCVLSGGPAWQGAVAAFSLCVTGHLLADAVREEGDDADEAVAE